MTKSTETINATKIGVCQSCRKTECDVAKGMDCKSSEEGDLLMANCNKSKCNAELDDTINRKCGAKGKKHISCAKDVLTDGLPVDRGWAWVVLFGELFVDLL